MEFLQAVIIFVSASLLIGGLLNLITGFISKRPEEIDFSWKALAAGAALISPISFTDITNILC